MGCGCVACVYVVCVDEWVGAFVSAHASCVMCVYLSLFNCIDQLTAKVLEMQHAEGQLRRQLAGETR